MSEEEGICRPAFKIYGICKKKKKKRNSSDQSGDQAAFLEFLLASDQDCLRFSFEIFKKMGNRVVVRGQIAFPRTEKRLLVTSICSLRVNVSIKTSILVNINQCLFREERAPVSDLRLTLNGNFYQQLKDLKPNNNYFQSLASWVHQHVNFHYSLHASLSHTQNFLQQSNSKQSHLFLVMEHWSETGPQ